MNWIKMSTISQLRQPMRGLHGVAHTLRTPGGTLGQKVVRGGFWVFALRITQALFSLIRTIVLARLLSPNDFGLFGIALLAMSALETFSQTGFQQALIQKKGDVKPYLDTVWTVQGVRGFLLAGLLYIIAPYMASFFGEPNAAPLLKVLGLSMVFQGFTNIGVVFFQKELEFHKQFIYQFSGTVTDLAVSITAAVLLKNAWALILGLVAANLIRMVVSYLVHPYRPQPRLEREKVMELYTFGKWIFGSSILMFLITQGDDIFVGKLLGAAMLGFYQMAYRISNMPATEITNVISQVTFPAYSKLQDNPEGLRKAYLKTLQLTAFISIPLAGGIFILAPEFTMVFLGEKWMPIVPAMQVLAIYGAVRSIGATNGSLFTGSGNPRFDMILAAIKLVLLAFLIYPLTQWWGITGTALATTFPVFVTQIYGISRVLHILRCRLKDFFAPIVLPVIGSVLMLCVIYGIKQVLSTTISILAISIPAGIVVYVGFLFFIGKNYEKHNILKIKEILK